MKKLAQPLAAGLLAASLLLAGCSSATLETVGASSAYELTQETSSDLVVLDLRTPEEYAAGHIEDSVLIDFYSPDFQAQLDALDKDTPYLIYCRSGNRSGQTVTMMEDLGFRTVYEVEGGIVNWAGAGFPVVAG